jgi:hypothetical protein
LQGQRYRQKTTNGSRQSGRGIIKRQVVISFRTWCEDVVFSLNAAGLGARWNSFDRQNQAGTILKKTKKRNQAQR